jgi:hypothetical protein
MARFVSLGEAVTRGEKKTLEYLRRTLPADWLVIGNPQISVGELTRELDAIVIGDRCIWVVDEKGFGGTITGDEFTWILPNGSARERVLGNVLHAASMVKGRITSVDKRLNQVWVEGLVLMSAEDALVKVTDARIGRHVRQLMGCENYFTKANIGRGHVLSNTEKQLVEQALCGKGVSDRLQKRLAQIESYKLIEETIGNGVMRTFRAERSKTQDLVEIKL